MSQNLHNYTFSAGQFWNVPVRVSPYTGEIEGWNTSEVYYVVNVTRPGTNKVASFTGFIFDYTWESEEGPCLYVGDSKVELTEKFKTLMIVYLMDPPTKIS